PPFRPLMLPWYPGFINVELSNSPFRHVVFSRPLTGLLRDTDWFMSGFQSGRIHHLVGDNPHHHICDLKACLCHIGSKLMIESRRTKGNAISARLYAFQYLPPVILLGYFLIPMLIYADSVRRICYASIKGIRRVCVF